MASTAAAAAAAVASSSQDVISMFDITCISDVIILSAPTLWFCLASLVFAPLWWNITARFEYRTKLLTKLAFGNARVGCYIMAILIFSLGLERDWAFHQALEAQPRLLEFETLPFQVLGAVLGLVGGTFVLTSMWALGVTGTYLGDYFGILMSARVTGFPFNVLENPMYMGSVILHVAHSLWNASPAGLLISVWVYLVYIVALSYEGPFTTMIYMRREEERNNQKKRS
eukprot:TRINITY_DN257_c0_g2_i1.p1 TRINITY_DN257_c0_g2~~TRINITY_DN257_c0_g2_i1.p1  ORF type:complete len:228 (-),score=59.26 TRINITY_DN257_c0_g2_i1:366-1049(-)